MSKSKGFLSAAAVAVMAFILSCSEDLKPIERQTWEEYQKTLQSSSSSELSSPSAAFSSSEEPSSSSAVSSSSEEPSSSSSTAIPSSSSSAPLCGGAEYNPDTQFCHNNQIVDKCNGKEYNPPEEVCSYGVVGKMCGNTWYNHQTYFCLNGTSTPLCGGEEYTGSQFCRSGKVYDKCGSIGEYDPSKFYCHNGSLSSCGNLPLNPDTQFCSGNTVYGKCGGSDYNPDTHFCLGSTATPLCGGQTYTSSQFCSANDIHNKCGGTLEYNPGTEACCGSGKYTIATHFCYDNSKVGSKCGARTEIFDPDLYECREGSKIYLKTPVSYGGKNYEAVLIGSQTWMAENLNYNDRKLYYWSTAMDIDAIYNISLWGGSDVEHQGICPPEWHIPSKAEWDELIATVGSTGGAKLKATIGWASWNNGTDDYGFSALPEGGSPYGDGGYWWSATQYVVSSEQAYFCYTTGTNIDCSNWVSNGKHFLFSVRCVQNEHEVQPLARGKR